MKRVLGIIFLTFWTLTIMLAQAGPAPGGVISGLILETNYMQPVEYANVVLYSQSSQEQVTGTISDKNGFFRLENIRPGNYLLEVKFIGFYAKTIENIRMRPGSGTLDLGQIYIKPAVLEMGGVQVTGEKPLIEYQIDKKVINVSGQITSMSGTAVDVLENIPSVEVDIEGNVSLRGSGSFTLLIDGRPSVLDPSDALQTIPASTIESIEIITNPSARFDPDGVSGIINIISKRSKFEGISGIANLKGDLIGGYGADFLANYRNHRYNVFVGGDIHKRRMPGTSKSESYTSRNDTIFHLNSRGDSDFSHASGSIRGGMEYSLTKSDLLRFEARYGSRGMERGTDLFYEQWTVPATLYNFYNSISNSERGNTYYSLSLDYRHRFVRKGHELSGQLIFDERSGDEESTSEMTDSSGMIGSGWRTTEDGPVKRYRYKVDYVLPLGENNRFEAGLQGRTGHIIDNNRLYEYDPQSGQYEFQDEYSYSTDYRRTINSLYAIYSANPGRFGIQTGLRGEYTYRNIELLNEGGTFSIDRWDIFPTLHMSYQYDNERQLMASYTRRIQRPRRWYLEPFLTWSDAYNARQGNPDLQPEYIDSYETGYQRSIGKSLVTLEAYYRVTHNKIEHVQSVYDQNIFLHTTANVGNDYALGTEMMLSLNPLKWWNVNLIANLYDYRVEGELNCKDFSRESFSWNSRLNNTLKFGKSTRIQLNMNYRSPSVSSQGSREGYFTADAAVRRNFFDRKLSATLQLRDIFGSAVRERTSEGEGFYSHNRFTRQSRVLSFTLSFNINNYKNGRKNQRENGDDEYEDDEL